MQGRLATKMQLSQAIVVRMMHFKLTFLEIDRSDPKGRLIELFVYDLPPTPSIRLSSSGGRTVHQHSSS